MIEYDKLIKLLRMTEGQFDNECLNAIRMANAMLVQHNVNWHDVLSGKVPMMKGEQQPKTRTFRETTTFYEDADEIEGYFDTLAQRPLGSFKRFVESVYEDWQEHNRLTEKQYNAIKNAATKEPKRRAESSDSPFKE